MNEQQFEKFLTVFARKMENHDLTVRIDENVKFLKEKFSEHDMNDTKEFTLIKQSVAKTHTRIDSLMKVKNMLLGAMGLVSFAAVIVTVVVKVISLK